MGRKGGKRSVRERGKSLNECNRPEKRGLHQMSRRRGSKKKSKFIGKQANSFSEEIYEVNALVKHHIMGIFAFSLSLSLAKARWSIVWPESSHVYT
jgi:hypothetical protein